MKLEYHTTDGNGLPLRSYAVHSPPVPRNGEFIIIDDTSFEVILVAYNLDTRGIFVLLERKEVAVRVKRI